MNMTDIITTEEARQGFYPTPPDVAEKLLEGIDWYKIENVLEPSAGKGNIVDGIAVAWREELGKYRSRDEQLQIDCIEIDPYLRSIIQYEYGGQHETEMRKRIRELEDSREYDRNANRYKFRTQADAYEHKELTAEHDKRKAVMCRIVHDNFLTFNSRKRYGLIVMNPPFSNGDEHLLHAIEIQSRYGGLIRCVLNAETLLNTYTNRRKVLRTKLERLGADVTFVDGAFSGGERKTDVSVAIIKIDIPTPEIGQSEIYERLKAAAVVEEVPVDDVTDLAVSDFIEQIVTQFNVEVDAGLALIHEYKAMQPYILQSLSKEDKYNKPILGLKIDGDSEYTNLDLNRYLRLTRRKYWEALFNRKEFIGHLTSNLREKYQGMVDKMQNYDFTSFNIRQIIVEMNAEMQQGVRDTIMDLFEKLTVEYSYYPEFSQNRHYYNGWKTNQAHKIGKKSIIPGNGLFSSYSWDKDKGFNVYAAYGILSDIEKAFDYLDGGQFTGNRYSLQSFLEYASEHRQTRSIDCTYFKVDLFKKGTVHIKFRPEAMPLVERLNIYAAKGKNWLPPTYGKKSYADMDTEEKAVVDGFHGDGADGSGEKAYKNVLKHRAYYLSEPTGQMPMLMSEN